MESKVNNKPFNLDSYYGFSSTFVASSLGFCHSYCKLQCEQQCWKNVEISNISAIVRSQYNKDVHHFCFNIDDFDGSNSWYFIVSTNLLLTLCRSHNVSEKSLNVEAYCDRSHCESHKVKKCLIIKL